MRLAILFVTLLLGASGAAHAQAFYLDLKGQRLEVPGRTLHVEQVLDGRGPTTGNTSVGMVYTGLHNRPAAVLFRRGLGVELTEWLQRQLPRQAGQQAVVLCVRQLRVSEVMNGLSEQAGAELAFDAYVHQPDGYHFVRRLSHHLSRAGMDMTGAHAAHVAQLFQTCVQVLNQTSWEAAARQPARQLAELPTDQPAAGARPAMLRAARPHRGIYRTPEQFLSNSPDSTGRLTVDTLHLLAPGWEGTTQLRPQARTAQGERVPEHAIWGFSDGQQAYIRHGGGFRPLLRQGDFYTFVGGAPRDMEVAQRRATNTVMYGAVGNMLTSSANDMTGRPTVYALDPRTGQTGPFPLPGQALPRDTAFVYIYRPPGGDAARRLWLNDREVGRLRPGDYLELPCPYMGRAVRLSLDRPDGPALLLVPDARAATYVKLLTAPAPYWQWMPPRRGEAEVDELEKARKP